MAPRPPESREQLFERLRRATAQVPPAQVRFGQHHHSHAVVVVNGRWQVRPLVLEQATVDAFRAAHHRFMPEDAEALSLPGEVVQVDAKDLEELCAKLRALPWPLPPR